MSVVTYGSVTFPNAIITSFSQDPVYDDKGQTDWCMTKFDVTVQAVINTAYLSALAPDMAIELETQAPTATEIMKAIRTRLMRPRQRFSIKFNEVELMPSLQEGNVGTVDAKNGPLPQSCSIMEANNVTLLITFRIVAHYWEANDVDVERFTSDVVQNKRASKVLFNRWSESVDIDELGMSRRTREGKFAIRSDNRGGQIVEAFRIQLAPVSVPNGFIRETSHYAVTPDGLAMEYRVTDREVFKKPPKPAWKAEGEYIESGPVRNNPFRFGEVRVKLWGPKSSTVSLFDQMDLVEKAIQVATAKIAVQGGTLAGTGGATGLPALPEACVIQVGMWENWVECRLRVILKNKLRLGENRARVRGIAGLALTRWTFTPFSDSAENDAYQIPYQLRGSAGLVLRAAAYFDPNLQESNLVTGNFPLSDQMSAGLQPGEAGFREERTP